MLVKSNHSKHALYLHLKYVSSLRDCVCCWYHFKMYALSGRKVEWYAATAEIFMHFESGNDELFVNCIRNNAMESHHKRNLMTCDRQNINKKWQFVLSAEQKRRNLKSLKTNLLPTKWVSKWFELDVWQITSFCRCRCGFYVTWHSVQK